jgi:hypothetical protein
MPATASATAFRLLAACAVLLASTAVPATAKDFCIDRASTGPNPDFVIRSFKVPKAGKCKPAIGVGSPSFSPILLNGVACGSSDGTHVSFQLNAGTMPGPLGAQVPSTGAAFGLNVVLATDTLQGLAFVYSGDTPSGGAATGAECKVPGVP